MSLRRVALFGAAACVACGGGSSSTGTKGTGGTGGTGSDTVTVTLVLHGVTGTESYENVAAAVATSTIPRTTVTQAQLSFFENRHAAGQDQSFPISVPKGQSISLYAVEEQNDWGDNTPAPPFYNPQPTDTAVGSAAIEFVSWSAPCGSASFGDCLLSNVQSSVQVTANFERLKSLNVKVLGVGQFIQTIQTRPPLSVAPVLTTNPINGLTDTIPSSIFTDSAAAYAFEVALFSGSQVTLVGTESPGTGFTVHFDSWAGGCSSVTGSTCIVEWPANPGGSFVYSDTTQAVPPPQANFQWWQCTDNGVPQVAQGANLVASGWSCALQSP
jgi:hypothetical protein